MKPITWDSTREEVLAAVDEYARRGEEVRRMIKEAEFSETPPRYRGLWSKDGKIRAYRGPVRENPVIAARNRAGEEDQSQPGWDAR